MYAVFTKLSAKGHFVGRERKFDTSSVAAAYDRLHLAKLAGPQRPDATGLVLMNTDTGRILRTHLFPALAPVIVEKTDAPVIKLSDAMKKALASANSETGVLSMGQARTLKALEDRGLVAISKTGAAKLTAQGRQYSRV